MPKYTYNINDDGALWMFDGINPEPFQYQPTWPCGIAWGKGEAKAWAEQTILFLTDPDADMPGDSPEAPSIPRPMVVTPDAIEAEEA